MPHRAARDALYLATCQPSQRFCCWVLQVMLGATIGIARPAAVTWLNSDLFTIFLGFLMLSMGLTLTVDDFKKARATRMRFEVLLRSKSGS